MAKPSKPTLKNPEFPPGTHVIVFPEASKAKQLQHPIYAVIIPEKRSTTGFVRVKTIAILADPDNDIDAVPPYELRTQVSGIQSVSATEALSSNMAHFLRASATAQIGDHAQFGQIVQHQFSRDTFLLHTNNDLLEVPATHIRVINHVTAMFLFNAQLPITHERTIDSICDAARAFVNTILHDDDSIDDLDDLLEPYSEFLGTHHMAGPNIVHWIEPDTGYHHKCDIWHAI